MARDDKNVQDEKEKAEHIYYSEITVWDKIKVPLIINAIQGTIALAICVGVVYPLIHGPHTFRNKILAGVGCVPVIAVTDGLAYVAKKVASRLAEKK